MVKKTKKKMQLVDPLDEVVVETDFESGSDRSTIHQDIEMGCEAPQRASPVKLTFKETVSLGGTIHVSRTDTTTNLSESPIINIPEKVVVIPTEVSMTGSVS